MSSPSTDVVSNVAKALAISPSAGNLPIALALPLPQSPALLPPSSHPPLTVANRAGVKTVTPVERATDPAAYDAIASKLGDRELAVLESRRVGKNFEFTYGVVDKASGALSGPFFRLVTGQSDFLRERNRLFAAALGRADGRPLPSYTLHANGEEPFIAHEATRPESHAALSLALGAGLRVAHTRSSYGDLELRIWSDRYQRFHPKTIRIAAAEAGSSEDLDRLVGARLRPEIERLAKPTEWLITDYRDTTESFRADVRRGIEKVPLSIIDELVRNGYSLHIQRWMLQAPHTFGASAPLGYSPGSTWNTPGGAVTLAKKIVVNELVLNRRGEWTPNWETGDAVVLHEVGHAASAIAASKFLEKNSAGLRPDVAPRVKDYGISSDGPFQHAYLADLQAAGISSLPAAGLKLSEEAAQKKLRLSYFLNDGPDGRYDIGMRECFAECVKALLGGESFDRAEVFCGTFPRTLSVVEQQLRATFTLGEGYEFPLRERK